MRVRFTPSGRTQFLAAMAYVARENPTAALALRRRAEKALLRLQKFPQSGRMLPEFPDLPFREVVLAPYRFFYRVKGKTIWVVAHPCESVSEGLQGSSTRWPPGAARDRRPASRR